ncbi:MAG: dTDP-4-dehydrorhamnose 3,5-epimerase family protein [Proteobacteria bacterium]|nr:dTDP-4-dehydrorhamnose 3,5-epimerase family protein [Pseudomonadota bacterium]
MSQTAHPQLIEGLQVIDLKLMKDHRGSVMHMLKESMNLGVVKEVYFSTVVPGVTKGWKRHQKMTQRFAVPVGEIQFAFDDDRVGSKTKGVTQTINLSQSNYKLLIVPPGIWYKFSCISQVEALIVNASDLEHDPLESQTKEL